MPTAKEVAAAWHSVEGGWGIGRNRAAEEGLQWEVLRDRDRMSDVITSDIVVLARLATREDAVKRAQELEDEARGSAVLALFEKNGRE